MPPEGIVRSYVAAPGSRTTYAHPSSQVGANLVFTRLVYHPDWRVTTTAAT
jgi:hypothetical protein